MALEYLPAVVSTQGHREIRVTIMQNWLLGTELTMQRKALAHLRRLCLAAGRT